jgi:hypothetical protein
VTGLSTSFFVVKDYDTYQVIHLFNNPLTKIDDMIKIYEQAFILADRIHIPEDEDEIKIVIPLLEGYGSIDDMQTAITTLLPGMVGKYNIALITLPKEETETKTEKAKASRPSKSVDLTASVTPVLGSKRVGTPLHSASSPWELTSRSSSAGANVQTWDSIPPKERPNVRTLRQKQIIENLTGETHITVEPMFERDAPVLHWPDMGTPLGLNLWQKTRYFRKKAIRAELLTLYYLTFVNDKKVIDEVDPIYRFCLDNWDTNGVKDVDNFLFLKNKILDELKRRRKCDTDCEQLLINTRLLLRTYIWSQGNIEVLASDVKKLVASSLHKPETFLKLNVKLNVILELYKEALTTGHSGGTRRLRKRTRQKRILRTKTRIYKRNTRK